MSTFRKELIEVLNKHSKENGSNTPDFILAEYLIDCLKAFDKTLKLRESWYGRDLMELKSPLLFEDLKFEKGVPFDADPYKQGTGNPPPVLPSTTSIDPQKIIEFDNTRPMIDYDNSNPIIDLKS